MQRIGAGGIDRRVVIVPVETRNDFRPSQPFTRLGGDSIKAVRVADHFRRHGPNQVSVATIFAGKTIDASLTTCRSLSILHFHRIESSWRPTARNPRPGLAAWLPSRQCL